MHCSFPIDSQWKNVFAYSITDFCPVGITCTCTGSIHPCYHMHVVCLSRVQLYIEMISCVNSVILQCTGLVDSNFDRIWELIESKVVSHVNITVDSSWYKFLVFFFFFFLNVQSNICEQIGLCNSTAVQVQKFVKKVCYYNYYVIVEEISCYSACMHIFA